MSQCFNRNKVYEIKLVIKNIVTDNIKTGMYAMVIKNASTVLALANCRKVTALLQGRFFPFSWTRLMAFWWLNSNSWRSRFSWSRFIDGQRHKIFLAMSVDFRCSRTICTILCSRTVITLILLMLFVILFSKYWNIS